MIVNKQTDMGVHYDFKQASFIEDFSDDPVNELQQVIPTENGVRHEDVTPGEALAHMLSRREMNRALKQYPDNETLREVAEIKGQKGGA